MAIVFGALFSVSSQSTKLIRAEKETADATQVLQVRLEQIQEGGWATVTSGSALQAIYSQSAGTTPFALRATEYATVTRYYPAITTTETSIRVGRVSRSGTMYQDSSTLSSASTVKLELEVQWASVTGGTRSQKSLALISQ